MKTLSRVLFGAVLIGCASFGAAGSGCSTEPDPYPGVVYEGSATSEALIALSRGVVADSPADAAEFTWPSNGDEVAFDPPPALCWHQGAATASFTPHIEDWASPRPTIGSGATENANFLSRWFGEGTAYAAAQAPLTGKAFLLTISSAANPNLIRVFTTSHDYTPDAAHLKLMTSAQGTLQATVTTAIFSKDALDVSGGPFKGIPVTFTMAQP